MANLRPIFVDDEKRAFDENSSINVIELFQEGSNSPVSVTAYNSNTGAYEVITREEAKSKPLGDYTEIKTNHEDAIRG